jgi:hypothetical protein
MATITVFHYKLYDEFSKEFIVARAAATRRAIDAAGGVIIEESAEEVDLECLNSDGIVVRRPSAPKPAKKPDATPAPSIKKPAKDDAPERSAEPRPSKITTKPL